MNACSFLSGRAVAIARALMDIVCACSLITWLLAAMGSYFFPDPETQETRTQIPAAMGRQSEGSILNVSKLCLDYAHVLD